MGVFHLHIERIHIRQTDVHTLFLEGSQNLVLIRLHAAFVAFCNHVELILDLAGVFRFLLNYLNLRNVFFFKVLHLIIYMYLLIP